MAALSSQDDVRAVQIEPEGLEGLVGLPVKAKGLVIFAHGSEAQCKRELAEIERRRELYRPGRPPPKLRDRTVIVVDDGIATGGTVRAVLRAVARAHPRRVVLAVPVAPRETINELSTEANDIVCLSAPEQFRAVGLHYRDFNQTTDSEVVRLLQQA